MLFEIQEKHGDERVKVYAVDKPHTARDSTYFLVYFINSEVRDAGWSWVNSKWWVPVN